MVDKAGTKRSYYSSGGALVASGRPPLQRLAMVGCFLARGETLMIDCVHGVNPDLMAVARESDRLGWDSHLEGSSCQWYYRCCISLRNLYYPPRGAAN